MLRAAQQEDQRTLEDFLSRHAQTSMFLRGNLEAHGLGTANHRHATDFWIWGDTAVEAVFGISQAGYVMCQMPVVDARAASAFALAVKGRNFRGMTGHCDQVPSVLAALGLETADWQLQRTEPLYSMPLSRFAGQDTAGLRPVCDADLPILDPWWVEHEIDTGFSVEGPGLEEKARERANAMVVAPDFRVFEENGEPVGMTNFNARTSDMVQLGGVFVPRKLRRQGIARRMISAQMAQAARQGVETAVLFAANPQAARVYEAIGFAHIGGYSLNLLRTPVTLGGPE